MKGLLQAVERAAALLIGLDLSDAAARAAFAAQVQALCASKEWTSAWRQRLEPLLIALNSPGAPAPDLANALGTLLSDVTETLQTDREGVSNSACPGTPLPVDADTLALYRTESAENIADAEASLLALEKNPFDLELLQRVLRAVHTVKGGSGIVGHSLLQSFAHDVESYLSRLAEEKRPCAGETASVLLRSLDVMKMLIASNGSLSGLEEKERCAVLDYLAPAVPQATASPKQPLPTPEVDGLPPGADKDLINEFLVEAGDYIQKAEEALLALEKNPRDVESINIVFRGFHTIKGVASSLDLTVVQQLAHHAESLMSLVRDGKIMYSGVCTDLALRSIDMLKAVMLAVRRALDGSVFRVPAGYEAFLTLLESATFGLMRGETVTLPGRTLAQETTATNAVPSVGVAAAETSADSSIRVRIERLDRLMDTVGELVISHSLIAQDATVLRPGSFVLQKKVAQVGKIVREIQSLSMAMRMVPLKPTFQKMSRLVRDVSQKCGKPIEFETLGEETEIDRTMVDLVGDPLVHMLRNAIDHGIETPDQRQATGKPLKGSIRLRAFNAGEQVVVELQDDGRGLDRERILAKALEKSLITTGQDLSDSAIYNLIFEAGFSTAEKVTDLSGRGVGMDVVRRNIETLRGRVDIRTQKGKGTTFTISLPLTLAITDGMLVQAGRQRYIIPTQNIRVCFRPTAAELASVVEAGEVVLWRQQPIILRRLKSLFDIPDAIDDPTQGLVIVLGDGPARMALLVDRLLGQHHVVAKSLRRILGNLPGISGAAILGDGQVGLILDIDALSSLARRRQDDLPLEVFHAA